MVSNVTSSTSAFQLPDKPFLNSASSTFFGTVFQENTSQFATLETAQKIASVLGGKVVNLQEQWTGGNQTTQYGIQMTDGGPILNAGLIASRCLSCGVEAGLSAALVESRSLTGQSISYGEAMSSILAAEQAYMAANPVASTTDTAAVQTAATTQESTVKSTPAAADTAVVAAVETAATAKTASAVVTETPAATESSAAAPAAASSDASVAADADTTTAATSTPSTAAASKPASDKLTKAAKEFEALMIGQMLKSVRESSNSGWLGSDSDSSTVSAVELAEGQMAQSLASQGGFGLAKMILDGFASRSTTNPSSGRT